MMTVNTLRYASTSRPCDTTAAAQKKMQHAAVAAGRGEDLLGFEKHAAADDDADDERDRRRQTVFFLQIVSHGVSLRCVCAERFYAPPPGESKGSVRRI